MFIFVFLVATVVFSSPLYIIIADSLEKGCFSNVYGIYNDSTIVVNTLQSVNRKTKEVKLRVVKVEMNTWYNMSLINEW